MTGSGRLRAGLKLIGFTAILSIRIVLVTAHRRGFFVTLSLGVDLHNANATVIGQYLDPIDLAAVTLHGLGTQHFTTRLALNTADRIGQTGFGLDSRRIATVANAFTLISRCRCHRNGGDQENNNGGKTVRGDSLMSRAYLAKRDEVQFGADGVNPI